MKKIILLLLLLAVTAVMGQNNSLLFDGTEDYVNCGNSSAFEIPTGTIEAWFKVTALDRRHTIIAKYIGGSFTNDLVLRINDSNNKIWFYLESTTGFTEIYSDNAVNINTWYHVAIQWGTSGMKMYVNGILQSETDAATYPLVSSGGPLCIGQNNTVEYFQGSIDEVRIWNDIRTEAEIRQNIYRELPDPASESNLVAYYQFNETSGTTLSDSKGSTDGTLTNMTGSEWGTSPAMFGPKNTLVLDGTDDYVDCGNISVGGSASFTYSAWIFSENPVDGTNWQGIIYHGIGAESQGHLGINQSGYLGGGTGNGTGWETHETSYLVPANTWMFVTMVHNTTANTITFYVNGNLIESFSHDVTPSATIASQTIGFGGSVSELFDGMIDEVRVWNDVRTETEIRENMCKTLTGNESGLVAYYNFDNDNGTTLQDFTGNGNDGTWNGSGGGDYTSPIWIASSAYNTWLNTSSSGWSTATNWSLGTEPSTTQPFDNLGVYSYSGGSDLQVNGAEPAANNFVLGNSASLTLSAGLNIAGNLILESNIDLNGQTVYLSENAYLLEDAGIFSGTSGSITTTRSLSNIDEDVAGLGAAITEDGDLGVTTITRGHTEQGYSGINRYYQITTTNAPTNATLVFNYLDSELDGATEANLKLLKSADGSNWTEQSATLDTYANTLTLSGINSFSYWTAGENNFGKARVSVKVFLEGPYDASNDVMTIALKTAGVIPTTSPYTQDARTVSSIPADIVDWVLVQIRSTAGGSIVASKSALLHKSGQIVGDDGTTSYIELEADAGDYFIVVKHRNHISVMSDQVHTLSTSSSTLYDFTVDESTAYDKYFGGDAALLEAGVYGMYSGDADGLGSVDANDRVLAWNNRNNTGYENSDCNLSGTVDASDRVITWNNRNITTNIP